MGNLRRQLESTGRKPRPTMARWLAGYRGRCCLAWVGLMFFCGAQLGCIANQERFFRRVSSIANIGNHSIVKVEQVANRSRFSFANRYLKSIPRPSERTELLLRRYDLLGQYDDDPDEVIRWLEALSKDRPSLEEIHGLAEIAEIQASWASELGETQRATELYATAVTHAYRFLFDSNLDIARNAYDPQFRNICDIYNRSLEGLMRQVCNESDFQPGKTVLVGSGKLGLEFEIRVEGSWGGQEFERFELVNDYRASGLVNHYHTYGLGVPLIAVRKQQEVNHGSEKYYPPDLTMPMTAFLHFVPDGEKTEEGTRPRRAVLTLYDSLEQTTIQMESKVIPLESDITTPLAYGLNDPMLSSGLLATASLINAEFAPDAYGMYMIEPYDPDKIPVVMVHGYWSSPDTWVHMFNDLRANRDIHENYQFWFYSYPTGQPFWTSARQMRDDLAAMRRELDPRGDSESLDQMILVGHSMGGLMSTLQTVESGDHFWDIISDDPITSLEGDPKAIERLRGSFYFHPNSSIDRVITIATPFQGSHFANRATRWISQRLFTLPLLLTDDFQELARLNKERLISSSFITSTTSTDSLAPSNPVFKAFANVTQSKSVKTHNIVGRLPKKQMLWSTSETDESDGDGVVTIESATKESAQSQVFVEAEHSEVHQHPRSIYEVRRILLENLVEKDRIRVRQIPSIPNRIRISDRETHDLEAGVLK